MEMCYNGTLVMPSNYVLMNEEEMMYLDGGAWSGTVFKKNLTAAYKNYSAASKALRAGGLTLGTIAKTATMTAKSIYLCYGAAISSTAYVIGGVVLGTILSVSLIAGIKYLGNHRVWY